MTHSKSGRAPELLSQPRHSSVAVLRDVLTHHSLLLLQLQPTGTASWLEAGRAAVSCLAHFICSSLGGSVLRMGPLGQSLILWAGGRSSHSLTQWKRPRVLFWLRGPVQQEVLGERKRVCLAEVRTRTWGAQQMPSHQEGEVREQMGPGWGSQTPARLVRCNVHPAAQLGPWGDSRIRAGVGWG